MYIYVYIYITRRDRRPLVPGGGSLPSGIPLTPLRYLLFTGSVPSSPERDSSPCWLPNNRGTVVTSLLCTRYPPHPSPPSGIFNETPGCSTIAEQWVWAPMHPSPPVSPSPPPVFIAYR